MLVFNIIFTSDQTFAIQTPSAAIRTPWRNSNSKYVTVTLLVVTVSNETMIKSFTKTVIAPGVVVGVKLTVGT